MIKFIRYESAKIKCVYNKIFQLTNDSLLCEAVYQIIYFKYISNLVIKIRQSVQVKVTCKDVVMQLAEYKFKT